MKRSDKKDFVQKLKEEIDNSSSVIVTHYSGLTVDESEQLRSEMRNNGAKFKVTKNRLTKLALEQTQFKNIADLFSGPTAIAYSDDPVAAARVVVSFSKENDKLVVVGGAMAESRLDESAVKELAALPSLDDLRGKIVGLLNAPATKVAGVLQAPAGQIARVLSAHTNHDEAA